MCGTAAAASLLLTVIRTSSEPALASARTCSTVPSMSAVSVLVMDCTAIGALLPMRTAPTVVVRLWRRMKLMAAIVGTPAAWAQALLCWTVIFVPSQVPSMERPKLRGPRLLKALLVSWQGLVQAWQQEAAFRQEMALAVIVIPLGLYLGQNGIERVLLIGPMFLVVIVELINSAVEATVDRIGIEPNALSGMAKDFGSAAVWMSLLLLVVTWLLVLWPA